MSLQQESSKYFSGLKTLDIRHKFIACVAASISLAALSSCTSQEQKNPFDLVKDHVWGDKVNGCEYQRIAFYNNTLVRMNSREMIGRIKIKNSSFKIEENEVLKAEKIIKNLYDFKLKFYGNGNYHTYKLVGETLQFHSTGENEENKILRNNDTFPTDFVICEYKSK